MKHVKSERLKKLELELNDLQQWLKLGLVPKKDIEKHVEEIQAVQGKIEEEKERLHFLKESGETEEYITPKRTAARAAYADMPSIPEIDVADTGAGVNESHFDIDTEQESVDVENSISGEEEEREGAQEREKSESEEEEEEEESYFSDRNRWKRGGIKDPDVDDW